MHVNIDVANSYYSINNSPCVQAILYIINQMQSNWPLSSITGQVPVPMHLLHPLAHARVVAKILCKICCLSAEV